MVAKIIEINKLQMSRMVVLFVLLWVMSNVLRYRFRPISDSFCRDMAALIANSRFRAGLWLALLFTGRVDQCPSMQHHANLR